MPCSPFKWFKALGVVVVGVGVGGGWVFGLIFAGYVPLASQNPYPIIVYYVAILWTPLVTWKKVIFAISTFSLSVYA